MVTMSGLRARARRWFWRHVRGYEYEVCERCGHRVSPSANGEPLTYWTAIPAVWALVMGDSQEVVCPDCFTRQAAALGVPIYWQPLREWSE